MKVTGPMTTVVVPVLTIAGRTKTCGVGNNTRETRPPHTACDTKMEDREYEGCVWAPRQLRRITNRIRCRENRCS